MLKKLDRVSLVVRLVALLVLAVVLYIGIAQLREFYGERVGFTAERAIEAYFDALASGDHDEVYRLTNKEHLTDIYGRAITRQEFRRQLQGLTGGSPMPFIQVHTTKLGEEEQYRYYAVELYSEVGGATRSSRVIVEVMRREGSWAITYPFAIVL